MSTKYHVFILYVLLGISCVNAQSYSDSTLKNIQDYLIDFKIAIDSKDTDSIRQFIFPTQSDRGDIVGLTVEYILKNDENKMGNFSYSDAAFNLIKDSLYVRFKPIPNDFLKMLRHEEDQRVVVDQFEQSNIAILALEYTHIILLIDERNIKLFFWENMNKLLR